MDRALGESAAGLMAALGAAVPDDERAAFFDPLLALAIILVAGIAGGEVARRLRVPAITGNIVAGALLGITVFRHAHVAEMLQPLSTFAIGLIAVTAGGHFSYRRIHNALRRILFISTLQVAGAVMLVVLVMSLMGQHWTVALTLGALAASTAPATTVAVIRETRAKGPAVKTLLASVSLDSSLCILLFAFVEGLLIADFTSADPQHFGWAAGTQKTLWQFSGSAVLGLVLGAAANWLTRFSRFHGFSFMLIAVLVASGLSTRLAVNPLLTCLFFGAVLGNTTQINERQLSALAPIEPMLYTAFFTLAGAGLHFDLLVSGGILFIVYLGARAVGKGVGAYLGAVASGASERIRRSVPFGFVPQAGVALGLVVLLQGDPRVPHEFSSLIITLLLASVTVNEIVGPSLTRWSLVRAQEAGLDRPRLVEFLQDEFVLVGLEAKDKWEAIDKLIDFYALTHRTSLRDRNKIRDTIRKREEEHSTALGREAALPHGWVDAGPNIGGVLAIAPEGIEWDAPDGVPVKLLVLIVTPRDQEARHLEVLSALSAMATNDRLRNRLISATDANDAWEALQSKESRDLNYFLEEPQEAPLQTAS